jgi:general secretion pathway protein M
MKDWFESLDARERTFLSVGAAIVVLALFYALIWQPLDKGRATLLSSVDTWERALAELRPLTGAVQSTGTRPAQATSGNVQTPVVIVDQTLRVRGLDRSIKRSQPTTNTGIRVEFENVSYDHLILWLGDLSTQHAMHVQSGSFSPSTQATPGRINATLTIERSH